MSQPENDTEQIRILLDEIKTELTSGHIRASLMQIDDRFRGIQDSAKEINRSVERATAKSRTGLFIYFAFAAFTFSSVPPKEKHLEFSTSKQDLARIEDSMSRYNSNWFFSYTENEGGTVTTFGIFGRVIESAFRWK